MAEKILKKFAVPEGHKTYAVMNGRVFNGGRDVKVEKDGTRVESLLWFGFEDFDPPLTIDELRAINDWIEKGDMLGEYEIVEPEKKEKSTSKKEGKGGGY